MKQLFTLSFSIALIFSACKKDKNLSHPVANSNAFLDSTITYLKNNLSTQDYATLNLNKYQILRYHDQNIGIQIFENGSSDNFLMLQSKTGNYKGNWVDMSQLNTIHPKFKSGFITLLSLDKTSPTQLMVDSNIVTEIITSDSGGNKITKVVHSQNLNSISRIHNINVSIATPNYEVLPEVIIYADNDGGSDGGPGYGSLYWITESNGSYLDMYYSSGGGGSYSGGSGSVGSSSPTGNGGAGGSTNNVVAAPTFLPPDEPVTNLAQELKCFTIDATSTYTISVNINEPFPGSRDVFNPLAAFMVGHTFLSLEQDKAGGSSIIRNVGFYPQHSVKPGSTFDQSVFGDDSNTPFDVSLKFTVTGSDLNTVINTLINNEDRPYDLNNFNCSTEAINVLSSIKINLPSTKATEAIFNGNDPADLGEDIRTLNLNDFSAANGNRKVTRTVSNSNNLKPLPREGSC